MNNSISITENKNSEKVVKFIPATIEALSQYCSERYAKEILDCMEQGSLWGLYFTNSGRIKANFI